MNEPTELNVFCFRSIFGSQAMKFNSILELDVDLIPAKENAKAPEIFPLPIFSIFSLVRLTAQHRSFTHTPHISTTFVVTFFFFLFFNSENCENVNATQTTCFSTCKTPDGFSRLQCAPIHSYAPHKNTHHIVRMRKHKREQHNNYSNKIHNINGSTLRTHFGRMVFCCAK